MRYLLLLCLSLLMLSVQAQTRSQLTPISSNLFLTYPTNEPGKIYLVNEQVKVLDAITLPDKLVRSVQAINNDRFYVDAKYKGYYIQVVQNKIQIIEERTLTEDMTNFTNFFYFFDGQREMLIKYNKINQIFGKITQDGKVIYENQTGFSAPASMMSQEKEYVRFMYHPDSRDIYITTKSNNVYVLASLEKANHRQRSWTFAPPYDKGNIYRLYDRTKKQAYILTYNDSICEIHAVPDINDIKVIHEGKYLIKKLDYLPDAILNGYAYTYINGKIKKDSL